MMNVVYATNDGYVRHLAASLISLLEHHRDGGNMQVFILSMGLSAENQEKLRLMTEPYRCSLQIIEMGDLRERFEGQVDTGGFNLSIMARLFIGDMLPREIDRVLYLDCDTIVLRPLGKLWHTDLRGKLLGAVMEPTIYASIRDQIGLEPGQPYYNSGVLLIDMKAWRERDAQQRLLDFYRRMGGKLFAGDQDTINGALKGEIQPLSPVYNFFTNYRYFHYTDLLNMEPAYGLVSKEMLKEAKHHPAVVHYMGDERPWKAGNLNHYRRAYEVYAAKTPWAGAPMEKGSRIYMLIYHVMDYATFLCPPVRHVVSRRFGMNVINNRKKEAGS